VRPADRLGSERGEWLDPVTGKVYWEVPFTVQLALTIMTPVHHGPYLFVATQYSGARMVKLDEKKPGAALLVVQRQRGTKTRSTQPPARPSSTVTMFTA